MYRDDQIVQMVAHRMGWIYVPSYDLFRKRMDNGDIISVARGVVINRVRGYSPHAVGDVFRWLMEVYERGGEGSHDMFSMVKGA